MIRFEVHVHPGARRRDVGGSHDGRLRVRVRARRVDGAATKETLSSLARAFGVAPADVTCLRGATSRDKTIAMEGDPERLTSRLNELLAGTGERTGA